MYDFPNSREIIDAQDQPTVRLPRKNLAMILLFALGVDVLLIVGVAALIARILR